MLTVLILQTAEVTDAVSRFPIFKGGLVDWAELHVQPRLQAAINDVIFNEHLTVEDRPAVCLIGS